MNEKFSNSEKGQAIIYLVLGIVVFLGFVALAIDGGMALADRRHSQNAADAASLAGGGKAARVLEAAAPVCYANWTCSNAGDAMAHAQIEARDRAGENGFVIDNNLNDHNGYNTICVDNNGKYIDVTVLVSDTTTSNFLQLIFPSALHNEVEAVTRVHPSQPIGIDEAVIGLNPDPCGGNNGVTFSGDATTFVEGGDVFSNGCIRGDGSSGSAVVISGTIEGHDLDPGGFSFTPALQHTTQILQPSDFNIPAPALDVHGDCIGGSNVYNVNNLPQDMDPGLYCVKGNLNINKDTTGTGVTIYMINGHLVYNGNASVTLSAPTADPDPSPAIPGVLIYSPNGDDVSLTGTSSDEFVGMIYAPKSYVSLTGNAENIFYGQVIGWDVKITGTNNFSVIYDECEAYMRPSFIELYK